MHLTFIASCYLVLLISIHIYIYIYKLLLLQISSYILLGLPSSLPVLELRFGARHRYNYDLYYFLSIMSLVFSFMIYH